MKKASLMLVSALILGILGQYGPAWGQRLPRPLRSAIRDYERANFDEAVEALEEFLAQPDLALDVQIEAMQHLAFSHIGLNDDEAAREAFTEILDLNSDYQLPKGLSPKIGAVFQAAFEAWQAAQPPTPPPAAKAGTPIWQIVAGVGLLAALLGGGGGGGDGGTSGIGVTIA